MKAKNSTYLLKNDFYKILQPSRVIFLYLLLVELTKNMVWCIMYGMDNINEIDINKTISQNITKYRKSLGITQMELAEKLNYSDKAVSKWERGESLPDIKTLFEISNIFGITLNDLCYNTKQKQDANLTQSKKTKHMYISILSCGLCWFVATIIFSLLLILTPELARKWLCFIYTLPISAIVCLVLNTKWGKRMWNCLFVSIICWGILLSICLTINTPNIKWLYLIGIPFEILAIIWYFFKAKIIEKLSFIKKFRKKRKIDSTDTK